MSQNLSLAFPILWAPSNHLSELQQPTRRGTAPHDASGGDDRSINCAARALMTFGRQRTRLCSGGAAVIKKKTFNGRDPQQRGILDTRHNSASIISTFSLLCRQAEDVVEPSNAVIFSQRGVAVLGIFMTLRLNLKYIYIYFKLI